MLQQTKVKTVIPYFENFVKKIPNLKTLSRSKEKNVLKLWEGLGYYRRAKNLHKTSKVLIKKYNGKIPDNFKKLKELPGIGDYTANILLALIYNRRCIGLDGNVKRVLSRLFNSDVCNVVNLFKTKRNSDLAEALIEFGALICKPKNPKCNECNLKEICLYYKSGLKIPSSILNASQDYLDSEDVVGEFLKTQLTAVNGNEVELNQLIKAANAWFISNSYNKSVDHRSLRKELRDRSKCIRRSGSKYYLQNHKLN